MLARMTLGKNLLVALFFVTLAIVSNWPAIAFHMMYAEQPIIYNANQLLHSFSDLIHIYTQPRLLDYAAPFFRPSGDFLMYQLITPLIGWHNPQGFIIINLMLLGLCGYLIFLLYQRFFPQYKMGGYLAASLYIMNPGLILVRFAVMHFEFAYVFCVLLSLYLFVLFCHKNFYDKADPQPVRLRHYNFLAASLGIFMLAFSFKEGAIMLGPVAVCYFLLSLRAAGVRSIPKKEIFYMVFLWFATCMALLFYLMLSWQQAVHPLLLGSELEKLKFSAGKFAIYLFSLKNEYTLANLNYPLIDQPLITATSHVLTWIFTGMALITLLNVLRRDNKEFKFSIAFLLLALVIFILLPLFWGMGLAWHLSLAFVCQSLLYGFGFEYYLRHYSGKTIANALGVVMLILIATNTYFIDKENIHLVQRSLQGFSSRLGNNAVLHPPVLKQKLTANSILIVQDNANVGDYAIGDSAYPVLVTMQNTEFVFHNVFGLQKQLFWQVQPVYNGTLFHWAYLQQNFKEAVVPFTDTNMKLIPDTMLLSWIRHLDNMVCLTYDKNAEWHDHTEVFKKIVLLEQHRRHLGLHQYHLLDTIALHSRATRYMRLPYADPEMCETSCDKQKSCKGFTYTHISKGIYTLAQCFYYEKITAARKPCPTCTAYIKSA